MLLVNGLLQPAGDLCSALSTHCTPVKEGEPRVSVTPVLVLQSKGGILSKACDYIRELRQNNQQLQESYKEVERVEMDNELLRQQVGLTSARETLAPVAHTHCRTSRTSQTSHRRSSGGSSSVWLRWRRLEV